MFAYCYNNPVNMTDPNGKSAILFIGAGILGALLGLNIGMELKKTFMSEDQKNDIEKYASDKYTKFNSSNEDSSEHIFSVSTNEVTNALSFGDYGVFYDALYQKYIEQADQYGIPEDERMSMFHIRWEFHVHVIGAKLNIKNAHTADLNYDETIFSMGKRYLKDKLCEK